MSYYYSELTSIIKSADIPRISIFKFLVRGLEYRDSDLNSSIL
jgi:hypothetical protein